LHDDLDSALQHGETLIEFVTKPVRHFVEFHLVQTNFAERCAGSLARYKCTGVSIASDRVLSKHEARVAAHIKQLRK
jgi:hypothetical protein